MKKWLALMALVPMFAFADTVTVSNKVLTVDQFGKINESNVLATVAMQATNATLVVIAEAAADAAYKAATKTSNDVNAVATAIVNKNLVVYSYGNVDSFNAGGFIWDPEVDYLKIFSTEANPLHFEHQYESPFKITADIPFLVTQNIPVDSVQVVASRAVGDMTDKHIEEHYIEMLVDDITVQTGIPVPDGDTGYGYKVTANIYDETNKEYFYRIRLENDTPAADGSTLDLKNGVSGGITQTFPGSDGWPTLKFVGGVLVGVTYDE